jgi:hypothetical protein
MKSSANRQGSLDSKYQHLSQGRTDEVMNCNHRMQLLNIN